MSGSGPMWTLSVTAEAAHRTVTLGQLREFIVAAAGLPDDLIVRGKAIPFHVPDLGNPLGCRLMALALDEDSQTSTGAAPNRAQRRQRPR